MKRYKKNTKLEVYWDDIVSDPTWQDDDKAEKAEPARCVTLGYYTMKRKGYLVLAHTITKGQRDTTVIPVGCISQIVEIS